jgi:hypothetical protein
LPWPQAMAEMPTNKARIRAAVRVMVSFEFRIGGCPGATHVPVARRHR